MNIQTLNQLNQEQAYAQLEQACCADNWLKAMLARRPFDNINGLIQAADEIWQDLHEDDYLAAFAGHPMIGDVDSLQKKYQNTQAEASHEQSGIQTADEQTIVDLAQANKAYLHKFSFIFIVCATGKSAQQMLDLLQMRLGNSRQQEIQNAAAEQAKITQLRLQKMFKNS